MQVKLVAGGVFVALIWTVVMLVQGPLLVRLWELNQAATMTRGIVIAVDASDHNRVTYRYRVDGVEYTNSEVGSFRKPGEVVTVYYASRQPSLSILGDPAKAFREGVIGTALLCAFFTAGIVVSVLRAR